MNDVEATKALRDALKKKFKGKTKIKCRMTVHYKKNLEREYERIIEAYYSLLLDALQSTLETIIECSTAIQGVYTKFRMDDRKTDFINYIRNAFRKADEDFHKKAEGFGFYQKIDKLGKLTEKLSINEWKKVVSKTLGINVLDDYYSGEFYREELKRWTEENANLITTLPDDALSEMQSIVEDGFLNGKSNRDIVKEVQERFNVSRNKAKFFAVDQLAKLNASIRKQQQTEVGVEEYTWSTSKDQRVRDSHKALEGTTHRWDDPPIVDKKTGRRAHPGEDYRCRCVALPIFNLETLNIPVGVSVKFK